MKKIFNILTVCLTMASGVSFAQSQSLMSPRKDGVSLGNVKVSREDKDLVLDYQILLGDNVLSCVIEVVMSVGGDKGTQFALGASELEGDFGRITESGFKRVKYNVEKKKTFLAGKDIRFTLNVKRKDVLDGDFLAMGSVGVFPQLSYGLMLGYVKKYGGYVKFRSDFHFGEPEYTCNKLGEIHGGGLFWSSGAQRKSRMQVTGGALFRLARWLYPYAGVGYGTRDIQWQDYEGKWVQVSDYSCKGISAEAGAIFRFGPVSISAGASTTSFKYTELEVGIGVMF